MAAKNVGEKMKGISIIRGKVILNVINSHCNTVEQIGKQVGLTRRKTQQILELLLVQKKIKRIGKIDGEKGRTVMGFDILTDGGLDEFSEGWEEEKGLTVFVKFKQRKINLLSDLASNAIGQPRDLLLGMINDYNKTGIKK